MGWDGMGRKVSVCVRTHTLSYTQWPSFKAVENKCVVVFRGLAVYSVFLLPFYDVDPHIILLFKEHRKLKNIKIKMKTNKSGSGQK